MSKAPPKAAGESPAVGSLARRLIRTIFGWAIGFTLLTCAVQGWLSWHHIGSELAKEISSVSETHVPLMSVSVWDIEPDVLKMQMQRLVKGGAIAFARLRTATGEEFAAGNERFGSQEPAGSFYIPQPNRSEVAIGKLEVFTDPMTPYRELAYAFGVSVAGYIVLTLLICVLVQRLLKRDVDQRLRQVASAVQGLGNGGAPSGLAKGRHGDELDAMVAGIAELQGNLDQQRRVQTAEKIRRTPVSDGVWLVEAPKAGVSVLCGCPADTVKHLLKRGLIIQSETRGVTHETGPNAILLSDLPVQNEAFANMAEFPVLQMLYRQGLLIPNHPMNTGAKPIIVGERAQVEAQLQYIYRGNYGLVSESEMIAAGASPAEAAELMQMKLKFAFGKIRDSGDFLDTRIVEDDRVEIRNGVGVRRAALNLYEFDYDGATVAVDLNLQPGQRYRSPLTLGHHDIQREYFAVLHTGEGDGWDVDRPSMASMLMFQGKIYLIDAGPAVVQTLEALGIGLNEVEGLFHTHSHDDHFAGLPLLTRTDRRLKYYATRLVRASVMKKFAALLSIGEDELEHYFEFCDLETDRWNYIEGLEVRPVMSPHPVETTIFQFRALWNGGYRTYAHLADISSFSVIDGMVRKSAGGPGVSAELASRVKASYLEPAELKKLDIGGGMIHGTATDFREDRSAKIVLAHTALALTDTQKEIGSDAAFGTMDVLIPGVQDFALRAAFHFLREDFDKVPPEQLRMLVNNDKVLFNPGTIFIREGDAQHDVYLILSGYVELLQSRHQLGKNIYAGSMVGEVPVLRGQPSDRTYRTSSYVQALRIPAQLYRDFVTANNLYGEIERLHEGWIFLDHSWLFGEGLSYPTLNRLSRRLALETYPAGHAFDALRGEHLYLVRSGSVERRRHGAVLETIGPGFFFGEGAVVGSPGLRADDAEVRVSQAAEIYRLPVSLVKDIPACRWKLLETYRRRTTTA